MSLSPEISAPTFETDPRFADPIATMPSVNQGKSFWGKDGFRFSDVLDTINPLQHIPVVSTVYRNLTGDEISPGARIAGGSLFGGPIGFISGLFNSVVEGATGRDLSAHVVALLPGGAPSEPATGLEVAALAPTPTINSDAATQEPAIPASAAAPADGNALALAALQRDLRLTSGTRGSVETLPKPAATSATPTTEPRRDAPAKRNIFAVPLPPAAGAASGATAPDGRKPGEYSAAELANILRAYQRAADTAGTPQTARTPRVED